MDENKNDFSHKLGYVFGSILVGCLMAITVAVTVRIIMWIL